MNENILDFVLELESLVIDFNCGNKCDAPLYTFRALICISESLLLIAKALNNIQEACKLPEPIPGPADPRPDILSQKL